MSLYSTKEMINKFIHGIIFSSTGQERDVIIESCSKDERTNMDTFGESSALYFYIHLPIIYELRV